MDLDIKHGEFVVFVGPSGCGKSTLLRTINRMYDLYPGQHADGELIVGGRNILERGIDTIELRAKVGMVFQKPTPFPMSIYENIAFGVRMHEKLTRNQMDDRIEWALTKAALWNEVKDKLNKPGTGLSGGQQQRLCIARGVAVKPQVLLLDEPTSVITSYSIHYTKLYEELAVQPVADGGDQQTLEQDRHGQHGDDQRLADDGFALEGA